MTTGPLDEVRLALEGRRRAGLWRDLAARGPSDPGRALLDLASNDYLGLATDPRVTAGAAAAAVRWGAGATGSRLVTGTTTAHLALEDALAAFVGADAALLFSSGYLANLAVVGALAAVTGPDTLVVSDRENHASLIDACRLARARTAVVAHRDVAAVDAALAAAPGPGSIVVTDAVFSVAGDLAPLRALHAVARRHGAWLVVDEAHALGVVGPGGRGGAAAAGLAGEPDVLLTLTLSKSLGSAGGAVLGPGPVRDLLVNTARPFIFDTALAPACVGGAHAALDVLRDEPVLPERARQVAGALAAAARDAGLRPTEPDAAVVAVTVGDPLAAVAARDRCAAAGLRVGCFRPPSVPSGRSCLRLTARATLTADDLERVRAGLVVAATAQRPD